MAGPVNTVVDTDLHTQFGASAPPIHQQLRAQSHSWRLPPQPVTTPLSSRTGGSFLTIAGPGSFSPSIGTLTAAKEPTLNNNGVVTFLGQGVSNFAHFTGNGGALTTIVIGLSGSFNGINDLGRVAFLTNTGTVQIGDGGPLRTVVPPGTLLGLGGTTAINEASLVAFGAQLPSGPTWRIHWSQSCH